jgi:hypothetical protein
MPIDYNGFFRVLAVAKLLMVHRTFDAARIDDIISRAGTCAPGRLS